MKNIITFGAGVVVLLVGWYLMNNWLAANNTVVAVNEEVTTLEAELASIETKLQAGELTPEQAVAARYKVASQLEKINVAIEKTTNDELSPEDKAKLRVTLAKFNRALRDYRDVLAQLETNAEVAIAEKPQLRRSGGKRNSIVVAINDIAENVSDVVEGVAEDISDFVDSITDDVEEATDDMLSDDSATSTPSVDDSDDGASDDTTDTNDDTMATSTDSVIEIEVDASATVTN